VAVLDLTEETCGKCFGVGMADVTTSRLFEKSNLAAMYVNALTSTLLPATKLPVLARNHRDAIGICIKTCNGIDRMKPRIVRIPDTLRLGEILVSEALTPEVERSPMMELLGSPEEMVFDGEGNLFS
jgi:sulfopyruvate decarboxylase TPP-binding subunit